MVSGGLIGLERLFDNRIALVYSDNNRKYEKLFPYFEKGELLFIVKDSGANQIHFSYLFGRIIKLSNFQLDIDTNINENHDPNLVKPFTLEEIFAAYALPNPNP